MAEDTTGDGWATAAALFASALGSAYSSQQAADQYNAGQNAAIDSTSRLMGQARNDAIRLFDSGRESGNRGLGNALEFYQQGAPARQDAFLQGNTAAQGVAQQGGIQANNAILGLPVDMSYANPQRISTGTSSASAKSFMPGANGAQQNEGAGESRAPAASGQGASASGGPVSPSMGATGSSVSGGAMSAMQGGLGSMPAWSQQAAPVRGGTGSPWTNTVDVPGGGISNAADIAGDVAGGLANAFIPGSGQLVDWGVESLGGLMGNGTTSVQAPNEAVAGASSGTIATGGGGLMAGLGQGIATVAGETAGQRTHTPAYTGGGPGGALTIDTTNNPGLATEISSSAQNDAIRSDPSLIGMDAGTQSSAIAGNQAGFDADQYFNFIGGEFLPGIGITPDEIGRGAYSSLVSRLGSIKTGDPEQARNQAASALAGAGINPENPNYSQWLQASTQQILTGGSATQPGSGYEGYNYG